MPKIWIDAGHGGADPGALGPDKRRESDDTLRFALALGALLERRGLIAVLTRRSDHGLRYAERTGLERREGCALAISCHRNGALSPAAHGAEVWVHSKAANESMPVRWGADTLRRLALCGLKTRFGTVPGARGVCRGYRDDPTLDYACNSGTRSPSLLLELGFITNEQDNEVFDTRFSELVSAVADALWLALFGEEYSGAESASAAAAAKEETPQGALAAALRCIGQAESALAGAKALLLPQGEENDD